MIGFSRAAAAGASFVGRVAAVSCLAAAVLLSGCTGGRGGPVPYVTTPMAAPDVEAEQVTSSSAPIGALDKIRVTVFQEDSLSGEFTVDQAGKIDYPLIGIVQVQGRTTKELGLQLAAALGERYMQSPNVSVSIQERAEQTVTVDGSVNRPGVFKVKGPTTLMQAVAMASGTSQDANPSRVYVFRTVHGEKVAGAFDLKQIRTAQAEDPIIYGNDIVVVDGSRGRQLFRDIIQTVPVLGVLRPF